MPRVFEVVCDEYHPITGELLLSEDKIIEALEHKTIKDYAYIMHNADIYTQDDEDKEKKYLKQLYYDGCADAVGLSLEDFIESKLTKRTDTHKADHWHVVIRCDRNPAVEEVAKWFGVPANFIHLPKGRGAFLDKCEYLTHENEKQQALEKHLYDDCEVHANFDFRKSVDEHVARRLKYGKRAGNISDGDIMQLHVMQDGWSMRRCRQEDPLTYIKVRNKLPNLRLDYLLDQPPQPFRISIYVDGPGGLGKGSICQYIGERLFPDAERPCFVVGNDPKVAFDGYDGEPVLIWEDYRAYKFISQFTREGTFAIFDSHPKVQSQQVKNSRIVLQNFVNIVNGVEPYADFLDGLAGEYIDKNGVEHIAEDKNQVYRRFQQIICIRENEYDVLFNRGFIDRDSHLYNQYDLYNRVTGSMSQAMQRLEGKAKEHILINMSQPAVDCYHMIESSHENKISEVEDIPDEFKHYGETKTAEDIWEEQLEQYESDMIEEMLLLKEYTEVFYPLWVAVHADRLVSHELSMDAMMTFEQWKANGCHNSYDKKNGFYRAE